MTIKRHAWFHLVLWAGLYCCWVLVFQQRAFAFSRTATIQFCYLLFVAANFYFNVYYNVPVFLYRRKYVAFGLLMLAGIIAGALLRVPLAMYMSLHFFNPGKPAPGFELLFLNSLLNIFIWVVCLVAGRLVLDRFRFQQYVDKIEKEKSKAELDFLKAQFNPHFLFNSLHSIYGHINKTNSTARNMLLTFSDMLRYQLYECNTETISIDKEISFIRNYVKLQQIRKEEDLVVQMDIHENVRGFMIVPLLFIAFIENAFKYVSNSSEKVNRVTISFTKEGERLLFSCYNTKEINSGETIEHKGIGIVNVQRRLELLYPGNYRLDINDKELEYEVKLKLVVS